MALGPVWGPPLHREALSFDKVEAVSKLANPETEEALVVEAMGLSNAAVDRAVRRANPPTVEEERSVWERRELFIQKNFVQSEGRLTAWMPGAEIEIVTKAISERADQMPVNPETGVHDSYPARMADGLVKPTTSSTGISAAQPTSTISSSSVDTTTGSYTNKAGRSQETPTARSNSTNPTDRPTHHQDQASTPDSKH